MFDIPDPIAMYESARTAGLERDVANAFVSAMLSSTISGMWSSGAAKWAGWSGEAQALKDAATAMYLSLQKEMKPGFLVLTVPQEMLTADNLSRFQTEEKIK